MKKLVLFVVIILSATNIFAGTNDKIEGLKSDLAGLSDSVMSKITMLDDKSDDFLKASTNFHAKVIKASDKMIESLQKITPFEDQANDAVSIYEASKKEAELYSEKEIQKKIVKEAKTRFNASIDEINIALNKQYSNDIIEMIGDATKNNCEQLINLKQCDIFKIKWSFNEQSDRKGAFLYNDCNTVGCVYMMSDLYKEFLINTSKLNKHIKLSDELTLKKVNTYSKRKFKKKIDKAEKVKIGELPIG